MNIFEICGILAGICAAVPTIPQIIQTIKTKNVTGLSSFMYYIWIFGGLCWIAYGWYLGSRQMQVFNSISVLLSLIMLVLIWMYKKSNVK